MYIGAPCLSTSFQILHIFSVDIYIHNTLIEQRKMIRQLRIKCWVLTPQLVRAFLCPNASTWHARCWRLPWSSEHNYVCSGRQSTKSFMVWHSRQKQAYGVDVVTGWLTTKSNAQSKHRFLAPSSKLCQIRLRHWWGTLCFCAAVHWCVLGKVWVLIWLRKQASAQAHT